MKQKKRYLLPLILLLTMLMMAGSVFAAPKLSRNTITIKKSVRIEKIGSGYQIYTCYGNYGGLEKALYIKGTNGAIQPINSALPGDMYYYTEYQNGRYYIGIGTQAGSDVFAHKINSGTPYYYLFVQSYVPKTYSGNISFEYKEKNYTFPLKIKAVNKLKGCISYLQIGKKRYAAPFKGNNPTIAAVKTRTGKKVKVYFKATKAFCKYNKIYVLSPSASGGKLKQYANGSKITLKPLDTIVLGKDKKHLLIPVTVNFDYRKYDLFG